MQDALFPGEETAAGEGGMTDSDRLYAIAVSVVSSPALNKVWNMIATLKPKSIYEKISEINPPSTQDYLAGTFSLNPVETAGKILVRAASSGIRVLTYWDDGYPLLLREIQKPPVVLYARGDLRLSRAVAVVGTRKSDARSSSHARRIACDLAACGFTVVSGMAIGIDREAHLGALDEGGGTIGVLANGIDIIYPAANRDLYCRIESAPGSALISEYPPGIRADRWTFVRRNRIISGLCSGTVVVKAGRRSGALITARYAIEQNRDVFACAGNSFDEEYAGCHDLIRNGAALVSSSDDIINELSASVSSGDTSGMMGKANVRKITGDGAGGSGDTHEAGSLEGRILLLVSSQDYDIDSIIRRVESGPADVNEALVSLELSGMIVRNGNTISRM